MTASGDGWENVGKWKRLWLLATATTMTDGLGILIHGSRRKTVIKESKNSLVHSQERRMER